MCGIICRSKQMTTADLIRSSMPRTLKKLTLGSFDKSDNKTLFETALDAIGCKKLLEDTANGLLNVRSFLPTYANINNSLYQSKDLSDVSIFLINAKAKGDYRIHDSSKTFDEDWPKVTVPLCKDSDEIEGKPQEGNLNEKPDAIDMLGCYCPDNNGLPCIFLWIDKIQKVAEGKSFFYTDLFTLVLLHELAHAFMDIESPNFPINKSLYFYKEESLANAMALNAMSISAKKKVLQDEFVNTEQKGAYKIGQYLDNSDLLKYEVLYWMYIKTNGI